MPWNQRPGITTKARSSGSGLQVVRRSSYPYTSQWSPDRVMREALDRVSWVFRCVQAIASNQSNLPLIVRQDDIQKGKIVLKHPLYPILNSSTNVGEDSGAFRFRLSAQLLLSIKGVFVEVVRSRAGEVLALLLLPPEHTTPIKDPKTFVSGYKVEIPPTVDQPYGQQVTLKPDQVIWIRVPHPFDPYQCITPMESLGIAIESDWLYKLYNRNFLLNDGRPGGLIVVKGNMDEDDKQELRDRYRGNINLAGRIGVIASQEGADFVDTAIHPRDAAYIDGKKITKEEILMGFGVPETVLGNSSGRTFDNAEQERLTFWMETMNGNHLPIIERPLDKLDSDTNHFLSFDVSGVDVIQRAEIKRRDFHMKEWQEGAITQNEYREAVGLPKLAEGGDTLYIPNTYMAVGSTKKGALKDGQDAVVASKPPAAAPSPMGRPQDKPTNQDGEDPEASRQPGERKPRRVAASAESVYWEEGGQVRHAEHVVPIKLEVISGAVPEQPAMVAFGKWQVQEAKLAAFRSKTLDDYVRWETIFERGMNRFFERQHRVVREKLQSRKMASWVAKHDDWSGDPPDVFDMKVWDDQLREDMDPLVAGTMQEFSDEVTSALGIDKFDVTSDAGVEARSKQMERVLLVNRTTELAISQAFALAAAARDDQDGLVARIDAVFADAVDARVSKIAETEVVAAASAGKWLGAGQLDESDTPPTKSWVTVDDSHVRETHEAINGKTVGLNESFKVGDSLMKFPGDPAGDPEEAVGCRCGLVVNGVNGPLFAL